MSAVDNLFVQVRIDTSPARRELVRHRQRLASAMYQHSRARGERPLDILAKVYRADLPTIAACRLQKCLQSVAGYDGSVSTPPPPVILYTRPVAFTITLSSEIIESLKG